MAYDVRTAPTSPQAGTSQDQWISTAAQNGWSDPTALMSAINKYNGQAVNSNTTDDSGNAIPGANDPVLQKLVSQGYLQPQGGGDNSQMTYGTNVNTMPRSASGLAPAFFQSAPTSSDTVMLNPQAVTKDPLYGNITANTNEYTKPTALDKYGPMVPLLAMGLPGILQGISSGGLSGGLSAAMSGAGPGSGMVRAGAGLLQGLANGQGFNPASLAGSALGMLGGQLGLPSWASPLISPVLGAAFGKGVNPMQLALSMYRSGSNLFGGGG